MIVVEAVPFDGPVAARLIAALDAELRRHDLAGGVGVGAPAGQQDGLDGEPDRAALNRLHDGTTFVVAYLDGEPVGCGALRPPGEVKRMYVDPTRRGAGIGRAILADLEARAAKAGYDRLVLETSIRQPEAIALYERAGFTPIPCYGDYATSTISRCFEKHLPRLTIEAAGYDSADAVALVAALHDEVLVRYADDGDDPVAVEPGEPDWVVTAADVAPPLGTFLVARLDGRAVGCGAVRRRSDDGPTGEVKRMFVVMDARGRGIARAILAELEAAAAALGYRRLMLETGTMQPEAMALYESAGWSAITPYGEYRFSPLSRCYAKSLGGG